MIICIWRSKFLCYFLRMKLVSERLLNSDNSIITIILVLFIDVLNFTCFVQISLIDTPESRRKKMMSLTSNVMRDESDKVKIVNIYILEKLLNHVR